MKEEIMKVTSDKRSLNELIARLKVKYPSLTNTDLSIPDNDTKKMLSMVAYKLRKSKEEMNEIIERL